MNVRTARVVQWICLASSALMLIAIFLAHAHGRAAATAMLFLLIAVVVGVLVGIAARAEGIVHLRKRENADWEAQAKSRFKSVR